MGGLLSAARGDGGGGDGGKAAAALWSKLYPPLVWAVRSGSAERVAAALEGAAPDAVDVNVRDESGNTPLHWAAVLVMDSAADIAQQLLAAGADVGARNEFGRTPLHKAFFVGAHAVAEVLLRAGADADSVSARGEVARELATRPGAAAMLRRHDRHRQRCLAVMALRRLVKFPHHSIPTVRDYL